LLVGEPIEVFELGKRHYCGGELRSQRKDCQQGSLADWHHERRGLGLHGGDDGFSKGIAVSEGIGRYQALAAKA